MSGVAAPARTFGQFVAEAEDGQLHADLSRELEAIVAGLDERIRGGAGKAKGQLTITLSFTSTTTASARWTPASRPGCRRRSGPARSSG